MKGKSEYIVLGLCIVLLFAAFTGIASAAEHHVYNGDSVQDVINNAAPGDTIYVHNYSGTYAPFNVNKQLYVIGVDMPTVDGGSTGPGTGTSPITISADDCTVKGFRVIRGCPDLWECGGIKVTSSNNIIEENLIESNLGNGILFYDSSSHNQVINNTIRNNGGNAPGIRYPDHCTIVGNTFSGNGYGALAFGGDNLVYHLSLIHISEPTRPY